MKLYRLLFAAGISAVVIFSSCQQKGMYVCECCNGVIAGCSDVPIGHEKTKKDARQYCKDMCYGELKD